MTVSLYKGEIRAQTYRERTPCEDEDRDQGDASTSQGTLKMANKPSEAGREAWNTFSLTALRRNQSCPHLDLGLQLPELGDNTFLI